MVEELQIRDVEVRCVGTPPLDRVLRASGVSGVTCGGQVVRCTVTGSMQPLLEALRGAEVIDLVSGPPRRATPGPTGTGSSRREP